MARLPGSVQGVVVQITMLASLTAATSAAEASFPDASSTSATGNFTHTVSDV